MSNSEQDMQVYSAKAVYDDPWSYCDTRYKIAGQWYGALRCVFLRLFPSSFVFIVVVDDVVVDEMAIRR